MDPATAEPTRVPKMQAIPRADAPQNESREGGTVMDRMVKRRRSRRRERAEDYCLEHAVELGLVRCSEPGCGKVLTLEEAREEDDVA